MFHHSDFKFSEIVSPVCSVVKRIPDAMSSCLSNLNWIFGISLHPIWGNC